MFNSNCASVPLVASLDGGNGGNNGNGMWGDGNFLWIIVVFALLFGWGNGGWGGNNGGSQGAVGGLLTRSDLCQDMSFSQLENSVRGIADGICSLGYDQLSQLNGINNSINTGFSNLNSAICQQQYDTAQMVNGIGNTIQSGFNAANIVALQNQNALQSQLAQCCCDNREAIANLKYDMATSDCSIKTLINQLVQQLMWGQQSGIRDLTELINAKFCQLEMSQKDAVIADLRTQLATCGDQSTANYIINQVRGIVSPTPVPAYPAASPCGLGNWSPAVLANGYGYGNGFGCGCNSGCGCA